MKRVCSIALSLALLTSAASAAQRPGLPVQPVRWCAAGLMSGASFSAPAQLAVSQSLDLLKNAQFQPGSSALYADLKYLTSAHRPVGSEGEDRAVQYLKTRFSEMGYTVSLIPYTDSQGRTGTTVEAVRKAPTADADILVLSAHHDSVPTAYGANDNASGVAALLAVARALQDVPTDTELRFISFTDEENGKNGSRAYTAALAQQERARMIGNIQLDMLGGLGSSGTMVCTADGQANWVSDLLQQKNAALSLGAETASDHSSFQLAGVPSVLVMQNGRGYLYHSAADTADQLNLWAIAGAAHTAVAAAQEIISPDTPSYRALARKQGDGYTYCQTKQNVIYFDSSLQDTEAFIGASGKLVDQKVVEGTGWKDTYDTYRYSMRWFGGQKPMNTYYEYRNGFLQRIEVRPFETGYTTQQVRSLLTAMYGTPTSSGTDRQENPYESWQDEIYSKYVTLTDTTAGPTVSVGKYAVGISNTLATYPVTDGQAQITDSEDKKVWDYLCSILPQENRKKISEFQLFTDGSSGILAYTSPIRDENGNTDNTKFSISVDYYDAFDENGAKRDWSKLTYTILHEYGHVLLEDETQIDLTVGENTHDPAGFVEGSFRKAFYDKFWKDLPASGVGDYEQDPTRYVSRYGANYFHEDIADTFAVFLLGGQPKGNTVAEEKLRFFWADADMVALRQTIRENLGLIQTKTPAQPERPEPPQSAPVTVASMEELEERLVRAIAAGEQPPVFSVPMEERDGQLPMRAKNHYFSILGSYPEYKYAYDFQAEVDGEGLLRCAISYMPYRTGAYPAAFQGTKVDSLASLIQTARENLDKERIPIRITDPALTVDDMNKALQQVGGSYLLCQLNRDGTAITVTPMNKLSHTQALDQLAELDALADHIYAACVTPDMSQLERAEALYTWLTENVKYDFRYYSEPQNLPYDSMTAYGALHDKLAICGGYAQAVQMLFERAGIPCVTISGKFGGEYHMWNIALLDGEWRYFDTTGDRGRANYGFYYFNAQAEDMLRHTWDQEWDKRLTDIFSTSN